MDSENYKWEKVVITGLLKVTITKPKVIKTTRSFELVILFIKGSVQLIDKIIQIFIKHRPLALDLHNK